MKRLLKKWLRTDGFVNFVTWLGAKYTYFVFKTTKWQFVGEENIKPYWQDNKPLIGAFWHGRMAMMCYSWKSKQDFYLMISAHRDGRLISKLIDNLGFKTITGSSSRGGSEAMRSAITTIKNKSSVGITPDGPRGPCYKAHDGIISIARLAQVDIIPATFSCTKRKIAKSWDKLIFPLPFGKGVIMYGKPIKYEEIKDKDKVEEARFELEKRLIDLCNESDKMCGHTPIIQQSDQYK